MHSFHIYRYDPDADEKPRMQVIELEVDAGDRMLLDVLTRLKAIDPSLSFRRSCREGVTFQCDRGDTTRPTRPFSVTQGSVQCFCSASAVTPGQIRCRNRACEGRYPRGGTGSVCRS